MNDTRQSDPLSVLDKLAAAIAAADVPLVLREFWDSEQVVMLGSEQGEEAHGPAQVEALWNRVLTRGQAYHWLWRKPMVVVVGNVAWIATDATVLVSGVGSEREVEYRATLVLVQQQGRWVVAQYHGSEPAAAW